MRLAARFWNKVKKTAKCWEWTGSKHPQGYGTFRVGKRIEYAHRVAYFLKTGRWPSKNVLHGCDNPSCVRFSHLEDGTQKKNMQDASARKRWPSSNKGALNPQAKLTAKIIRIIRNEAGRTTQTAIARRFGVGQPAVSRIISGARWA